VLEPRGAAQMSTNILIPKTRPEADAAFMILQGDRAHAMSGSNSICLVTVLLETGMVPMIEPETTVTLETPAGLVTARARCRDGRCEQVTLTMTPAFVDSLDLVVPVEGLGEIKVDIAYGGCFYALVDARQFGLTIAPENARRLVEIGMRTQSALNRLRTVVHPEIPAIRGISYTMLTNFAADGRPIGATVLPPGRLDRSPCGTGNAARMALRHARGEVAVGDTVAALSTIGGSFDVRFTGTGTVAGRPAVATTVTGRAWIYGTQQLGWEPTDPFPEGFLLADTWGDALDLVVNPRKRQ
jgi:proline racemase